MARTDSKWNDRGSYIESTQPLGVNILINGTDKYLNFNAVSGALGYGIRDNGGNLEFKNNGGAWTAFGSGGGGGSGDVVGAASSTDNAVARYDGTTGKLLQNSGVIIDDSGRIGVGTIAPSVAIEVSFSDANTTITTGNIPTIRVTNPNTTVNNMSELAFTTNDTAATNLRTSGIVGIHTSHTIGAMTGVLGFLTREAGTYAERMRLSATELLLTGDITLASGKFLKRGTNVLFGGNTFNTLIRPDSSGGEIQIQAYAGTVNTIFFDSGAAAFGGDVTVPDEAYNATTWNGSLEVPTKNAIRDKIESMGSGGSVALTEIEVDMGTRASSKRFTITDAAIDVTKKILVFPSPNAATGRRGNDWEVDQAVFTALAGTGNFLLSVVSPFRMRGNRKLYYQVV